jgi:hypothetical protein
VGDLEIKPNVWSGYATGKPCLVHLDIDSHPATSIADARTFLVDNSYYTPSNLCDDLEWGLATNGDLYLRFTAGVALACRISHNFQGYSSVSVFTYANTIPTGYTKAFMARKLVNTNVVDTLPVAPDSLTMYYVKE